MKALVTGGAGFIGSHLVDRLVAEGHQVDVIDNLSTGSLGNLADTRRARTQRLSFHQVDIRDAGVVELIERRQPEVVFHLAAAAPDRSPPAERGEPEAESDAPERLVEQAEIGVVGGLRVLEGARRAGTTKVVFAASTAVYQAPAAADLPLRESHPQMPLDPAGVAQKAMIDYLGFYRERFDLEFTVLVPAEVYGPRQRHGPVGELMTALVAGQAPVIDGDGSQTRDFVFVDDVVDAFVRAAERGSGLVANIGTGVETAIRDLHHAVGRLWVRTHGGEVLAPSFSPASMGPARMALDSGRAQIHLGWEPWTPLDDGLEQVVTSIPCPE